jgi:uncharacterized protein
MTENFFWILIIIIPVIAFLYSSVGHGGASSYIMLLILFNFAPEHIRPTALILNIFVSAIAYISYSKVCRFQKKLFLNLILFSVPASFIGGTIEIDSEIYKNILGFILLFPIIRLFNIFPARNKIIIDQKWWLISLFGLCIGFVSGLIGIGGGIILSPLLLLLGWTNVKETAAISALFIFANSISGLIGSGISTEIPNQFYLILAVTIMGGIAGAYTGANKLNIPSLKYLLGIVLLIAASKFILT